MKVYISTHIHCILNKNIYDTLIFFRKISMALEVGRVSRILFGISATKYSITLKLYLKGLPCFIIKLDLQCLHDISWHFKPLLKSRTQITI